MNKETINTTHRQRGWVVDLATGVVAVAAFSGVVWWWLTLAANSVEVVA